MSLKLPRNLKTLKETWMKMTKYRNNTRICIPQCWSNRKKDKQIQVATFLCKAGPQALQIFNLFKLENPDDKHKIQCVKNKYC